MSYISKYDTKFVTFINRRYKRYKVSFEFFDDYILWLYYTLCKSNSKLYYKKLENDLWAYSDWQTGTPREKEKLSNDWKNIEKDKYGLLQNEHYVEYLKRREWKNEKTDGNF